MMNVFNLVIILPLIFRIIVAWRHCNSTADCGFGGGCFKIHNTGICDCTLSSRMFEDSSRGECSQPVKNCDYLALKWKTKHFCGTSGKCINVLGSFYCTCEEGCYGQFCKQCYKTKGGSRVDVPYFVYEIKGPLLKTRYIIVCHEKLGTNFSAYLSVHFPNQGSITRILSDKDFSTYKNPYEYCLTRNIPYQLCKFLPKSHKLCVEHPCIFPYEYVMSEQYTKRNNFYLISYDCGNTRTRHGFVRDFYFSGALSFYSDWKDKAFICAPQILIQDVGKTLNTMLYYPEGFLFTLRVNTDDNPHCTEDYVFSLYSWKLFNVNQTWSQTYEPVAIQDGGTVFPIHEYTLPTTGMFKVEVWVHVITRVAEKPKMYLNFGYGYFYSDFSRPEPVIKGGTERTVPSNTVLVLDATNSYGTTLPRLKDKRLIYIWSCNLTTLECADKETKDTIFKPNIQLLPGMVIKFTLSVYYLPFQYIPDETFTSTQIIRVVKKNVSEVLITCFCNCITENFGVNPDEYFCLRASKLITSDDDNWNWKCYDKNTNTYLNIDEIREPNRDSSELVIKGGKLKQNRMYLFSVQDLSSSPGRAEMLITVDTQCVVNISLFVARTDSTGIYHKILARGFYNVTKSHFAIYCEFFHKANSDNELDVMFAFNTECFVKKTILITGRIYVRFCDFRGSCSSKEGQVNVRRPPIQIVIDMLNNLPIYLSNPGKFNDALMYIITICHYVNGLESKVETVENILYNLMKLDVYFFRDSYQIASIFLKCFAKRHELNHNNSTINIFILRSATEFLRKLSMKIKNDVKTTFLNQADHSENDYRNFGLLFIQCLDIILENKEIILSQPELVNDIEILIQVHKLTDDIRSILEDVSKFIGRKLIYGVTPVILKTKNIIFWLQKDELLKLSNRKIPTLNEFDNNMKQKNHSKIASLFIPISMARIYDKKFLHHILNVNIFNLNPFLWEPNGRKPFPAVIYTNLRRIKDMKHLYATDRYHRVRKHFNLFYNINYDSKLINGTVALPYISSNLIEKDKAIRVYRLLCDTGVFKIKFSNLTEKQQLLVVFTKNMIPDYDIMMNKYLIVNRIKDTHVIDFQANKDSNSLCYIGILPGPEEKENNFVKYEFKISKIDCYVWSDIYTWVPGYCNVVARETDESVHCQCKHFSGFTISSYPPLVSVVNVRVAFVNIDKIKNRFVGLFLLALLSLFIVFGILVYFLDKKDDFAAKVIILEDNIPGYRNPYLIGVYTGNRISAGTSATIGLQIYGKRAKSKIHILKCSYRKVLTRGSDDWFIIFTKHSLGSIKYLYVWADFHGNNPSWFCSKIVVIDIDKKKEYVFILDEWLTIYLKEDAVLTHELSAADKTEKNNRAYITAYNTAIAIREGHIWSGLLCRHPRSNFRRVQRLGVLLFMVFSLLTVIFYFESDMFRKKRLDLPSFTAFDEDVMFKCILSLCIVLPFVFLLSYCFKKSTAANYYNNEKYDKKTKCFVPRSTENLDNYSENVQFISTLLMLQPLQPIVITDKDNYVRKRRNKWTLIAWIAIAICVPIEFSILLYFGHNFPLRRSCKWILITLFANCLSAFVIEPTILLFSSMILGYVFGVSQKETTILLNNEHKVKSYNDKLLNDEEFFEELEEIRSQHCYKPLAVKKERLIREIMYPKWCQKWSAVDLILILIYLLLFFFILKRFTVMECNMTSRHLNKLFSVGNRRSKGFFNISRRSEFLDFLAYNFLEKIHVFNYYSNGQLFADGDSCNIPADLVDFYQNCNDMLEGNQDTKDYRIYWFEKLRPDTEGVMGEIWNYMNENQTRMFGIYGKSGKYYNGGGYVVKFSNNRKKSRTIVEYIREHDWMDDLTRAIFMELILYNVNTNTFTAVIFMGENFASGAFITKMMVQPLIVHQFNYNSIDVIIILLVIIVICSVGARTIYLFQLYGVRFFRMISNVLNLITFILGIILILLATFHFYFDVLHANIQFNESDDFLNLYKFIFRERICIEFCAMFTAFTVIRLLFFWFFSPINNLLSRMLYYTFISIGIVLVILFCFCLILLQYFPALLQNPAITSYSIFLTHSLNFNQIVKNTMINEKIFLPFLICVISGVACLVIRLLIIFFCSVAHYNLTYNLFNIIDKRSLASLIPDHLHRKSARSRQIKSNDAWKSVTSQESDIPTTLSDYRLAKLRESAINALLSERK